jgi:hypothetical protein
VHQGGDGGHRHLELEAEGDVHQDVRQEDGQGDEGLAAHLAAPLRAHLLLGQRVDVVGAGGQAVHQGIPHGLRVGILRKAQAEGDVIALPLLRLLLAHFHRLRDDAAVLQVAG